MVKYGARDQSGKKKKIVKGNRTVIKTIAGLSNSEIVKKEKFRPREYSKVERYLDQRNLVWNVE